MLLRYKDFNIKIWNAIDGTVSQEFKNISQSEITAVCLDDRGRKFFVGNHSGEVIVCLLNYDIYISGI